MAEVNEINLRNLRYSQATRGGEGVPGAKSRAAPNVKAQVSKVKALWEKLNTSAIHSDEKRATKGETYLSLVEQVAPKDEKTKDVIESIKATYKTFKNSPTSLESLMTVACNLLSLPNEVHELADPELMSNRLRFE